MRVLEENFQLLTTLSPDSHIYPVMRKTQMINVTPFDNGAAICCVCVAEGKLTATRTIAEQMGNTDYRGRGARSNAFTVMIKTWESPTLLATTRPLFIIRRIDLSRKVTKFLPPHAMNN